MLKLARILKPTDRRRAWLLYCAVCDMTLPPGPFSNADARVLEDTPCPLCTITDEEVAEYGARLGVEQSQN